MNTKNGLQKFTKFQIKTKSLFELSKINLNDLKILTDTEIVKFYKKVNEKFNSLTGVEKDLFFTKIENIITTSVRNQVWENNHTQITAIISNLMVEYGRMPTKNEIAKETCLSRQTIHKHIKEYSSHPMYLQQMEQYKLLNSTMLAKVYKLALQGDTGAAKLYFRVTGLLENKEALNNTQIQTQNNFIQINGRVLSQENIKHLNPEQLNNIETILQTALPQLKENKQVNVLPESTKYLKQESKALTIKKSTYLN